MYAQLAAQEEALDLAKAEVQELQKQASKERTEAATAADALVAARIEAEQKAQAAQRDAEAERDQRAKLQEQMLALLDSMDALRNQVSLKATSSQVSPGPGRVKVCFCIKL